MKRHSFAPSLVLAVLAALGLAGPVAAQEQVSFKGTFEGVAIVSGGPAILTGAVNATGHASQLTQFALAIPHQVDRGTSPFPSPWTSTGFLEFVTASGDTLSAIFTGEVNPVGPSGVLADAEDAIITRGTGRFAGATGTITVARLVIPATATTPRTTIGSFNGTISLPVAAGR